MPIRPGSGTSWTKEREATVIKEFEALAIPGLFQTEDYARALFRACKLGVDDEEIDKHVAGRLERQQILTRAKPPMMWVVLDEAVIRRPVGGPQVMYDQLAHLTEVAGLGWSCRSCRSRQAATLD